LTPHPTNEFEQANRRRLVLRYYLRGMNADQIAVAKGINASRATIYNDLEELKLVIAQKIDAEELWPIRHSVALRKELIREAWRIYYLPPRKRMVGHGEERHEELEDVSWRQLSVLRTIDSLASSLDRLAFGVKKR